MDNYDDHHQSTETASFRHRWDVFLSFRGEDTRHNFTNNLYNKLSQSGVRTFLDDESLSGGDEIGPTLLEAIQDSTASIVVISPNYASSRWCLQELTKIVEFMKHILPVFYFVDPSDVRRQKGPFEAAFGEHEELFGENMVFRWREAMMKAGGTTGWVFRGGDEQQLIQALVDNILTKLNNAPLSVAKYPVGINARVEEVMRLLNVKSNGVRVIGLHGMGGIGKTTLAKAVYNKVIVHFKHHSFIANVREIARQHNGLISLQNQLIHDLFPGSEPAMDDVTQGILLIKKSVYEKRVLVVLDDVDDVSQLDALAGWGDWLFEGSRIIITTRDEKVLMEQFVNEIYEVKELSSIESIQLFSCHAFGRDKPFENFVHLSKKVVQLTGGLPLALEVFGSFLFDKRRIKDWVDALEKLGRIRPNNLQEVLKISFDGLDEQEKVIFLDIACFFVGMEMKRDNAIDILKGCGFNAEIAITVLTAKSLIKIIDDETLWMHDQLRDMGRQIVCQESLGDPGVRSRLWDYDEVMTVLKYKKGTRSIQGIVIDFKEKRERKILSPQVNSRTTIQGLPNFISSCKFLKKKLKKVFIQSAEKEKRGTLCTKPFEPMVNLRLVQINHANWEGLFECFPAEVKWLEWKGCPLRALPSDFPMLELAVLDLTESKIKQVWDHTWKGFSEAAGKLVVLNLYSCFNLTVTPDFSGHQALEKLILECCTKLVEIHKSIGYVSSLRLLNLRKCPNLVVFPNDVSGLRHLETLILSGCSKLKDLPEDLSSMKHSLKELFIDGTAIEKVPDSISCLKKLERLSLHECQSLRQLPNSIGNLCSLREFSLDGCPVETLPDSIGFLANLEKLTLERCKSINALPDSICNLKSLLVLFLDYTSIKELPASIGSLALLRQLSARNCQFLGKLPTSIGGLVSLSKLELEGTPIMELPDKIGRLNVLEILQLRNCVKLCRLPDSIGNMLRLTMLILDSTIITELPDCIGQMEKLEILSVEQCRHIIRLPASIAKLKSLLKLLMEDSGVAELPEEIGMLSRLVVLKMGKQSNNIGEHTELTMLNTEGEVKLVSLPASFSSLSSLLELDARCCRISGIIPDDFQKLSSLESLKLGHNNICSLPSSLRGLYSLKKLSLPHCAELKSLPPLPSSLIYLDVTNCFVLETISDLSNLNSLQELHVTNCSHLVDIPGLECLKSLRWLYMSGCDTCFSVVRRRFGKVLFKNLRTVSFPGGDILNWLAPEVRNSSHCRNREIKGVVICVAVSLNREEWDALRDNYSIIMAIQVKVIRDNMPVFTTTLGIPKSYGDQLHMCRFVEFDSLVLALEDGDGIKVAMRSDGGVPGLKLKDYGIHLIFEGDDDDDDTDSWDGNPQSVSARLAKAFSL